MEFYKRQSYETLQIFAGYLCLLLISLYLSSHYLPNHGPTQLFDQQQECEQFKSFDHNYQTFLDDLNSNNFNFNDINHGFFNDYTPNQFEAYDSDFKEEKLSYDTNKFISHEPDFSWRYDHQFEKIQKKKLKTTDYQSSKSTISRSEKSKKDSIYDNKKKQKNSLSQQLKDLQSVRTDNARFNMLIEDHIKDGLQLQKNDWKSSKRESTDQLLKIKKKSNHNHKFALSKLNSWESHLKSLRTHFLQQLFNEFQDKLWKVPNQKLIKEYAFSSDDSHKEISQYQKQSLITFLESRKSIIISNYEHFDLKRDFYLRVIKDFIQTIQLAWSLEGKLDNLLYEILFKVKIKSLFQC